MYRSSGWRSNVNIIVSSSDVNLSSRRYPRARKIESSQYQSERNGFVRADNLQRIYIRRINVMLRALWVSTCGKEASRRKDGLRYITSSWGRHRHFVARNRCVYDAWLYRITLTSSAREVGSFSDRHSLKIYGNTWKLHVIQKVVSWK